MYMCYEYFQKYLFPLPAAVAEVPPRVRLSICELPMAPWIPISSMELPMDELPRLTSAVWMWAPVPPNLFLVPAGAIIWLFLEVPIILWWPPEATPPEVSMLLVVPFLLS